MLLSQLGRVFSHRNPITRRFGNEQRVLFAALFLKALLIMSLILVGLAD